MMKQIVIGERPPAVAHRPICPECMKRMRPYFETVKEERVGNDYQLTVTWNGHYHGYGYFDTMRCAVKFANSVVRSRRARV